MDPPDDPQGGASNSPNPDCDDAYVVGGLGGADGRSETYVLVEFDIDSEVAFFAAEGGETIAVRAEANSMTEFGRLHIEDPEGALVPSSELAATNESDIWSRAYALPELAGIYSVFNDGFEEGEVVVVPTALEGRLVAGCSLEFELVPRQQAEFDLNLMGGEILIFDLSEPNANGYYDEQALLELRAPNGELVPTDGGRHYVPPVPGAYSVFIQGNTGSGTDYSLTVREVAVEEVAVLPDRATYAMTLDGQPGEFSWELTEAEWMRLEIDWSHNFDYELLDPHGEVVVTGVQPGSGRILFFDATGVDGRYVLRILPTLYFSTDVSIRLGHLERIAEREAGAFDADPPPFEFDSVWQRAEMTLALEGEPQVAVHATSDRNFQARIIQASSRQPIATHEGRAFARYYEVPDTAASYELVILPMGSAPSVAANFFKVPLADEFSTSLVDEMTAQSYLLQAIPGQHDSDTLTVTVDTAPVSTSWFVSNEGDTSVEFSLRTPSDLVIGTTTVGPGVSTTLTYDLSEPGDYVFFLSVGTDDALSVSVKPFITP